MYRYMSKLKALKKWGALLLLMLAFPFSSVFAQPKQILEEVVALIGDNIILKSEWEAEYLQVKDQYTNYKGNT